MTGRVLLFIALAGPPVDGAGDPYAAQALSASERRDIERREVVIKGELYKTPAGKNAGRGVAFARFNRGVEPCWTVLAEYEKHPVFMPRLVRVTFLSRSPDAARVAHEVEVLWATYRYTLDLRFDPAARKMSFALDKTAKNDIKDTSGSWELFPLGEDATLVKYTVAVDSGMFVPGFLEDFLARRDLPSILENYRRRVESGATWKKDD